MTDGSRQSDLTTKLLFLDWYLWFFDTIVFKYPSVLEGPFIKVAQKPLLEQLARQDMSSGGKGWQICKTLHVNDVVAKEAGCSPRQVGKIETVLTKAPEQLKQKEIGGRVKVDKGYNRIKSEEARRKLILESQCNPQLPSTNENNSDLLDPGATLGHSFWQDIIIEGTGQPLANIHFNLFNVILFDKKIRGSIWYQAGIVR